MRGEEVGEGRGGRWWMSRGKEVGEGRGGG